MCGACGACGVVAGMARACAEAVAGAPSMTSSEALTRGPLHYYYYYSIGRLRGGGRGGTFDDGEQRVLVHVVEEAVGGEHLFEGFKCFEGSSVLSVLSVCRVSSVLSAVDKTRQVRALRFAVVRVRIA